ncbi:MAG: peptidoglycan DD-metalloendopeptidase family protein [Candidatus Dormibacteraeota bacterium]|nr:peptidoglycan DD-metalloendopeptidase family protein [Candidatus Dormibacteraeota bacterium]
MVGGPLATTADEFTDNIGADQQKLAQNAQVLQQLSASIASAQLQEPQIQADIDKLNQQMAQTAAMVTQNQSILDGITAALAASQAKLAQEQAKLAEDKQHLADQLVIVYELQQQSTPLNNLLTSHNFNDFWQSLIETRRISGQTSASTVQVQQAEAQVRVDIVQITAQQQQQQSVVNQLVATKNELAQENATKQRALAALQAAQAADQAKVAQLTASNDNINNEIASLNAQEAAAQAAAAAAAANSGGGGGGGGGGSFIWPDSGPVSQGFGCTTFQFEAYDASCPYPHRFHNGIDIAGACGNAIVATAAGVVHIEPYDPYGYGNYIIIQHGGGWSSLYGHMSGFAVGNGATVGQGQQIGREGSTGNSTGCHLHFGINSNNQWLNPLRYLP